MKFNAGDVIKHKSSVHEYTIKSANQDARSCSYVIEWKGEDYLYAGEIIDKDYVLVRSAPLPENFMSASMLKLVSHRLQKAADEGIIDEEQAWYIMRLCLDAEN